MAKVAVAKSLPPAKRVCVGCDAIGQPAEPGAPLCVFCAETGADAVVARIWGRHERHGNLVSHLDSVRRKILLALAEEERHRWYAFDQARQAVAQKCADDAKVRKESRTIEHLKSGSDKVTQGMRDVWRADEEWYWQSVSHHDLRERYQAQTKIVIDWFEQQGTREEQV